MSSYTDSVAITSRILKKFWSWISLQTIVQNLDQLYCSGFPVFKSIKGNMIEYRERVNLVMYGNIKSQPEAVIEPLVKGSSQAWEHRWKFPRPHSRVGHHKGRISTYRSSPLEYLVSPDHQKGVSNSFFIYRIMTFTFLRQFKTGLKQLYLLMPFSARSIPTSSILMFHLESFACCWMEMRDSNPSKMSLVWLQDLAYSSKEICFSLSFYFLLLFNMENLALSSLSQSHKLKMIKGNQILLKYIYICS